MKFWRTAKSKLVNKIIADIWDTPQEFKLPQWNDEDERIQARKDHFRTPEADKAMKIWLCKNEYGQDARSLAKIGQTFDNFPVAANLSKFSLEIAAIASGKYYNIVIFSNI